MSLKKIRGQLMLKKILLTVFMITLFSWGNAYPSGNPGDYIQVGDGYLGTAATLNKADVVASNNDLPTGAAIIAWGGGGGGTGYWTQDGSDIYYTTGNVSIGTNTATQLFHTYVAAAGIYNLIESGGAYYAGLILENTSNTAYIQNTGAGVFNIVTGGAERLTIASGGNVGIGAIVAGTKLEVDGVITATDGTSTNWNTAYTDRLKWDGGADSLVSATAITSLGLDGTASGTTSGAYLVGVFDEFTFSSSSTVQEVLADLDYAISTPTEVSDVRMGRARFNSTTGVTVPFSLPALGNADYDVVISNYTQAVNVGEISIESKTVNGFVLKNSGSDDTHFFEYFAIPYAFKGETMQEGTDTFNSTTGVSVAMAPNQADTDYSVIIAVPAQTDIEDIGVVSIETKAIGSFVVKNSGDDTVTDFKWMVIPYTVAADTDQQGTDNLK